MSISSGLFNRTLVLQRQTLTNDGMGGQTKTWADAGSFRGRISPLSAQERLSQSKETMTTTHRIYCANMNVMPDDRIRWGTYYFEIVGITNPSETYHHLEIDVREVNYP
jgi:SPP1 family predicted phage head-tail adaptor